MKRADIELERSFELADLTGALNTLAIWLEWLAVDDAEVYADAIQDAPLEDAEALEIAWQHLCEVLEREHEYLAPVERVKMRAECTARHKLKAHRDFVTAKLYDNMGKL